MKNHIKKLFWSVGIFCLVSPALSFAGVPIYYLNQPPKNTFSIIKPLSANENSEQKAFDKIQKEAAKIKADAVVDFECQAVSQQTFYWHRLKVQTYCRGKAVKFE